MELSGLRKHFGQFAKFGNALSSSVGSVLGLPIAIDFGTGSLKVLQVAAGDPPVLVAAANLETPDELMNDHKKRLEFQLEGLPRLIKRGGFKGKRAVCAIPAWQTKCKHVSLARADGMSLAEQVNDAIAVQFGRDPATLVYRYIEVPSVEKSSKAEVMIAAVPRELVEQLMKGIADSKLQPVGMHGEFACVLRTFEHVHRRDADATQNTLYLDLGATTTKVMISHGKELAFARVISLGGRHLDDLLVRQLKCDLSEARRIRLGDDSAFVPPPPKAKAEVLVSAAAAAAAVPGAPGSEPAAGAPGDPQHQERSKFNTAPGFSTEVRSQPPAALCPATGNLSEPLESVTDEVLMCLRYHDSQFPGKRVDRAMFVGGEARHRGLCQAMARALRLPAQMADPLARIARTGAEPALGVDLKQPQPGWAVALGLCLSPTDL
jgi:type IV pilus assembly protein PilM